MVQARVVLWFMLFFTINCNILLNNNLNIAIVSMVKHRKSPTGIQNSNICHSGNASSSNFNKTTTTSVKYSDGTLEWTETDQNLVLGAFYLLPWMSQFFGGVLAHKYGTKLIVGTSTLIASILSSLIPSLAYIDPRCVMVLRTLQGLVGFIGFPVGIYAIIGKWTPPHERGKFITVFLGTSFGISIGYPVFGYIADTVGWQYIFYFTSLVGFVWYVAWQYLVYDTPDEHPRISLKEKQYIKNSLGKSVAREKLPIPWKAILTSIPVLVNIICQFGVIWGRFTLNIYVPSYFKEVHGLSPKQNGLVTGMPFLLKSVFSYVSGATSDILLRKNIMSKTGVRNSSVFVSSVVCGLMLIAVSYSGCDTHSATLFMALCIILNGCFMVGSALALVDMSPNFCSVLQGLCGSIGMLSGFISPMVVSLVAYLQGDNALGRWKFIWQITGAIYVVPGLIFLFFSDSELQPWNNVQTTKSENILLEKNVQ